ncbi:MAG: hypothetical protein ACOH5I_05345 [Oligoflexus sp.]
MQKPSIKARLSIGLSAIGIMMASQASAIFVDGQGHYGLRGETRTRPGFNKGTGSYQAIDQFFRLDTELRVNDKSSFFAEFRLFDDQRENALGDSGRVLDCPPEATQENPNSNIGSSSNCGQLPNSTLEPRYEAFVPRITKAYARYAMDYCLLTVGRRDRHWGMGLFMDSGKDVFDTDATVYDGFTCDVNLQKTQTLSFSLGYDKITETGASVFLQGGNSNFGPMEKNDDLDQFFFTIEYNDHKANAGKGFSQQIGIYFANIIGGSNTKTDIKLADLYLNFLVQDLVIQQEILFRLGKSADPNLVRLGGLRSATFSSLDEAESRLSNDVQSIAAAGSLEYFLSRSGTLLGPARYNQGTAKSHSLFIDYAYAPGDSDGYYPVYPGADLTAPSPRDNKASAVAFHRNFKPALLLFNGRKQTDNLRIDGVFDPYRLMNVTVFSLGYRYRSVAAGDFEAKLVTASLNEGIPGDVKANYENQRFRPIGYEGKDLGFELDISYNRAIGQGLELGAAVALGLPGQAWEIDRDQAAQTNYLFQGHAVFRF